MSKQMRTTEAAAYVQLSPGTLAKMRVRGDGPPYSKAGARIVIYAQDELDSWLNERRRRSTSDEAAP